MRIASHDKNYLDLDSVDLAPDGRGRLFASTSAGSSPVAPLAPRAAGGIDELETFLSLVAYDEAFRVDGALKESPHEVTQRVFYEGEQGRIGPFVRKYLKLDSGLGAMYETIRVAQEAGAVFRHLPRIHACYRLKDDLVVIMEHVNGETLQDVVCRRDPSPDLAMEVFPLACEAVRELHERFDPPIIHRDLKPSNLILSWDRLTLIDFGIARRYAAEQGSDTVRFGTRDYAPPEQFGFKQTDVRSDVYALGMILHYLLTERVASEKDRDAHFAHSAIPEEFRVVIDRACAFDPDDRFASVAELERAFDKAAAAYRARVGASAGERPRARCPFARVRADGAAGTAAGAATRLREGSDAGTGAGAGRVPKRRWRFSAPGWLGVAWNTLVVLVWLLLMWATLLACFSPNEADTGLPLWFRVLEYPVFLGVSFTLLAYLVMDRRALRRRFARLGAIPVWTEFAACFAVMVALFVVVVIVGNAVVPGGAFVAT